MIASAVDLFHIGTLPIRDTVQAVHPLLPAWAALLSRFVMIALDTMIQTMKSGTTCRVQDLEPGSPVYNPVSDSHSLVAGVLHQQITPDLDLKINASPLLPVRLKAGKLGAGLPKNDLIMTAGQRVLIQHQGVAGVREQSAASLCNAGLAAIDFARTLLPCTHYLVLFDGPSIFLANGVMLVGVGINDIGSSFLRLAEQKMSDVGRYVP